MKGIKKILISSLLLSFAAHSSWAQGCSVCTQTASQLGDDGAKGLNTGILYLALLPITFISVLGFVWWKYNRGAKS
jgi:hypothetical protein